MKAKIWKTVLPMTIAILLVFVSTSCNTNKPETDSAVSKTSSTSSTSSASSEASGIADKSPVTLTIGFQTADAPIGEGVHNDYKILKELTDKTGITLSYVIYDDSKFKVLSAGGDLPDIMEMIGSDSSVLKNLISSGTLKELDGLLDQYGQNIKNNIPTAIEWAKQVYGNEKTYLLPIACTKADKSVPQKNGFVGFAARYDLYKAIGSPEINGEDGYLNVLKQMQDYQRQKSGDNTVYALSAWTDSGLWPYMISYPFSHGYYNLSNNQLLNRETGEVESEFLNETGIFWKGVKFFNKAYRLGVFDPEGFTMKNAQYVDKISNGKVLVAAAPFWQPNVSTCGENAINALLPGAFPVLPDIYSVDLPVGYGIPGARAVNANCKYPERAMQLLNYLDSEEGARLVTNGVKGSEWDVVSGVPQYIGGYLEALKNGTQRDYDKNNKIGIFETGLYGFMVSGSSVKTEDGYPIDLKKAKEFISVNATPAEKAFAQSIDSSLTFPGQVYDKWVKEGKEKTYTTYPLAGLLISPGSDKTAQAESQAASYFMDNVAKVIMAKDDAAFDSVKAEMIKQFKAMGLEACDAEVQKNYESAKELAKTFK